jgi:hypothetical protein
VSVNDPKDIQYQEAMRRYQVDVAKYETAVQQYKEELRKDGEFKPSRPIPPIPPIKPLKLSFVTENTEVGTFNEGIEAAAISLEMVGERELAGWVRSQKR